jgi:hypothetical protein
VAQLAGQRALVVVQDGAEPQGVDGNGAHRRVDLHPERLGRLGHGVAPDDDRNRAGRCGRVNVSVPEVAR